MKENYSINMKNIVSKSTPKNHQEMCLLFFLLWHQEIRAELIWKEFEDEIRYKNRFFPKGELLDILKNYSSTMETVLISGTILYRARKYETDKVVLEKELKQICKLMNELLPDFKISFDELFIKPKLELAMAQIYGDKEKFDNYSKAYSKIMKKKKKCWGYNEKNSDAPSKEIVGDGRANPSNISYLYVAENIETAIMEVRPIKGQLVSVAKIKIIEDIKLFDFCKDMSTIDNLLAKVNIQIISKKFSEPNCEGNKKYYTTQYLCEYIKELGFDGIKFYSSLKNNGVNIVLFNTDSKTKKYKILNSSVYNIDSIEINFNKILPTDS